MSQLKSVVAVLPKLRKVARCKMTSQGDLPLAFKRAAIRFDVAESDYFTLQVVGITTLNGFAYKIPKSEELETFLRDKILDYCAYQKDDESISVFRRTPPEDWREWKLSDDAAALRRLWQFAKETAKGDIERMASGDETHRKITLLESNAMENDAIKRGLPVPGSDRERPSMFSLNKLGKALQNPGATYEVIPWESYISKDEEDRLVREGKMPKGNHTELVLSKDKVVAKDQGSEDIPGVPKVEDMEKLRNRLELRARAMEFLDLCSYNVFRSLSDKYYGKLNGIVPSGMRCPTLSELRRFDREMQTHIFRFLSRGQGSLQDAVVYYVEKDDSLWRLLDPVVVNLPDQGVEGERGQKRKADEIEKKRKEDDKDTVKPTKNCLVCGKKHLPLCALPPDFRAKQRAAKKEARAAKKGGGKGKQKSEDDKNK